MLETSKEYNFWQYYDSFDPCPFDAIVCTTNTIVKANGELVMGKGIALDFSQRYKGISKDWGQRTLLYKNNKYNSLVLATEKNTFVNNAYLISFPTKYHWKDKSDIDLIVKSAKQLKFITNTFGWQQILMTRPGCGNGGLYWNNVKTILDDILDDRFTVVKPILKS